ncbi:Ig-like domain-containing protein [Methanobacterium paludis]|uniref:SbsA Ig-like domain-containing protein n=1 Tax=Methanobacterium paludis (strain DSM 25820 / JCM 18151 / SWAN1) TaxID=868131 RepID=F6D884_METPW|nr:Ig-like domain-containing protein [Methanobacterium paludis]AEG17823.1 hypothetical protein MSWAN_0795 [Methanobacterium paludis]
MAMFLLCGVALLNLSDAAASNVNSTNSSAPHVTAVDPSNNAVNVQVNKVINVTFNESIKKGSNWIELQNSNGTLVPISTSISGNVLTITPNNNLTNGIKYTVLIHTGSVTDLAGNNVAGYVTRFTTDGTAPTVKSSDPSNKAVDVLLNKVIKVTFSEAIKTGSNWIELQDSNGTIVPIKTSISGNVLTVTPLSNLSEETNYVLLIHTGSVTDLAGNNAGGYVTRFRTDTPFNQAAFNQIMRTASKFGYCSGISTASGIAKCCRGDCWAMSAYLFQRLSAANITCRIEQYSTSSSSRHRSVQYLLNGSWVNVPYATWGFNWNFRNTANIKYGCTIAQS